MYLLGHLLEGALFMAADHRLVSHTWLDGVINWMDVALSPEPEACPSLARLIGVIEALLKGTLSGEQHENGAETPCPGGDDSVTQPFDVNNVSDETRGATDK